MSPAPAHPRPDRGVRPSAIRRDAPGSSARVERTPRDRSEAAPALGPKLRAIRLRRGVGLRELARRLDVSPSSISKIETGKNQPSVRTLYAFASELQVTIDEVLDLEQATAVERVSETPASVAEAGAAGWGLALQRAERTKAIRLESGVQWKRLMHWSDEDLEFIETTYEPGDASSRGDNLVRHNGHEFVHVLSGELRVVIGVEDFVLRRGDSLAFPSSTPHRLSNDGDETARAIWIVSGRRGTL
jgi:transcriptional regulator with XRE-family HTH domain